MESGFNYNILLNQALDKIRNIRDPRSLHQEYVLYGLKESQSNSAVSIGGEAFTTYSDIVESAQAVTIQCLEMTIFYLLQHYGYDVERVDASKINNDANFAILDKAKSTLLLFKKPFNDLVIAGPNCVTDDEDKAKECFNVEKCVCVFLMYDRAPEQFIPTPELNQILDNYVFSLKTLFDRYFNDSEFATFHRYFSNYTKFVNKYLGFTVVKNLTPVAQSNFSKIVKYRLEHFDYKKLLTIEMNGKILIEPSYNEIATEFIKNNKYLILLGSQDFAESLITAEWMYDSMKEAQAIDLTIIGMGYLKAVEQLIYSIVLLHKNEGRNIKSNQRGILNVCLDDEHIDNNSIDSSIGSLANFCKNNLDIFSGKVHFQAKKYVTETIFAFKDIRNGYFHKHNIHDWSKIDEIRNVTYYLAFLLLGAAELTDKDKATLGFPNCDFISDKYKLCEYINYHDDDAFVLCYDNEKEIIAIAHRDLKAKPINNLFTQYSGAYFSEIGSHTIIDIFTDMPNEIYLCRIDFELSDGVQFNPTKVKKIFAYGKFVGPDPFSEDGTRY